MKFKSQQTYDKLRGGYYTPAPVAEFLTRWVLGGGARSLLEPSCGDGSFLEAAISSPSAPTVVHGVEIDSMEAEKSRLRLGENSAERRVFNMDFLRFNDVAPGKIYDAVVGNPPYIRYQFLPSETQELARELYRRHSLTFTKHLNAWAPFVVDSLDRLAPGGRLGMIVPAELLNVIHSGGLRHFLLTVCSRVLVIDPQELIFDGALQGTVFLLAQKRRPDDAGLCGLAITYETDNKFLDQDPETIVRTSNYVPQAPSHDKWMTSLLTSREQEVLARAAGLADVHRFSDVATVAVGVVTGANNFFLVPDATVDLYGIRDFAHPMFGRSFHCRGVIYSQELHAKNGALGLATNFIQFGSTPLNELPKGAQAYIREAEALDINERYKCRIREPWYNVPSVWATRLALLKRCHELPRLIVNEVGAYTTDTAYRVTSEHPPETLVVSFVNSLTALTAELRGRAYGGGVLELVPSEIRGLLIPLVEADNDDLRSLDGRFAEGDSVDAILETQDKLILGAVGLMPDEIATIQRARARLRDRRLRQVVAQ
jgi:adenine-specific DNA methylase